MSSVGIHPPKTPVTKGSMGIAKATLPNVCKMPAPPAPFVPSPLPNIARSGQSPEGYSTTVKIEGSIVAIRGAMFESMGDIASKGTGGGLLSSNTHGPAKFITPGSMTVKIEGKAVHLLGEPMFNNCGPGGNPPNTGATMAGLAQDTEISDCPGHEIEFSELTEEAERKRRDDLEAERQANLAKSDEAMKFASYHSQTGRPKASWGRMSNVTPPQLLAAAVEQEGYAEDKAFEQKVADDAKAVWTGIKYRCKKCKLAGEIDIITPKGIIKECKRNGTIERAQVEKYAIVGPIIVGAGYGGLHQAIPSSRMRTLADSSADQGLVRGKDFEMQPH